MGAAVLATATALLAAPGGAGAATTCELTGAVLDVTMSASGDSVTLGVDEIGGAEILVLHNGVVTCAGGTPTVSNTDAISVHNAPGGTNNDVQVNAASRFAPGKTAEPGHDEIEIFVNLNNGAGSELRVNTGSADGNMHLGTGGINTNATGSEVEPDADIISTAVPFLRVAGETGSDVISAQGGRGTGGPLPMGIQLSGGAGNDTLIGGEGPDFISNGGGGSDFLLGVGGADTIDGGPGNANFLSGGEGDDVLAPGSGDDSVVGGPGADRVTYFVNLTTGVSVDLDPAQEIETVQGTNFDDTLRGDAGPNVLRGLGGNDVLEGRGGNDTLEGAEGDDSLNVRDGGPDTADCGGGTDTVTADAAGTDSLTGCESVLFPASPDPGGAGSGEPRNDFTFGKVKKNKRRGTAKLTVIVPGPGEIDLARSKKVKAAAARSEGESEVQLRVKPKGKARKKLGETGKAKVNAEVTFTPDGGAPGTASKRVKLKRNGP